MNWFLVILALLFSAQAAWGFYLYKKFRGTTLASVISICIIAAILSLIGVFVTMGRL